MQGFANATEHLYGRLELLELRLRRQVLRLRAAHQLIENDFRGIYLPDEHIDAILLNQINSAEPVYADQRIDVYNQQITQLQTTLCECERLSLQEGVKLPLLQLRDWFSLSSFELDLLVMCIAPELELHYQTLYAYIQNDVNKKLPTPDLALKLHTNKITERIFHQTDFSFERPLIKYQLIKFQTESQGELPLISQQIKTDVRIINFLLAKDQIDPDLQAFTSYSNQKLCLSQLALDCDLKARLEHIIPILKNKDALIVFQGLEGVGKQSAATAICTHLKFPLLVVDIRQALSNSQSLADIFKNLHREALLKEATIYIDHADALWEGTHSQEYLANLAQFISSLTVPLFLASEKPIPLATLPIQQSVLSFEFPLPNFTLRHKLWEQALKRQGYVASSELELTALANKFVLSAGQINSATQHASIMAGMRSREEHNLVAADLYKAARMHSVQTIGDLAQKIDPKRSWGDIVLPTRQMQQLREVYSSVKYRHVIYTDWGFGDKLSMGKGLNVLFSGPSGTGKTLSVEILAYELGLDLYKIDLANVVSKYIGETEKNLDRIFRAAETSNAILFFDEADALFGKRSEVKDARDRYANIEVAYLLQKMEAYEGITVMATNMRGNLDDAFARRFHHMLELPFPDEVDRKRIWCSIFPPKTPLSSDINFHFLAQQFKFTGGNIRNIALAAAFMAAEESQTITMQHLIVAVNREFQKVGKLPSKTDFQEYYEFIRG